MDLTLAVALLALAGTVVSAVLMYRASTRATAAQERASEQTNDVSERANDLQWVKELRDERQHLASEVEQLRATVATLRRELGVVTREAEHLIQEIQLFRRTAWRDGMTIERYREFIGPPPAPANARPS